MHSKQKQKNLIALLFFIFTFKVFLFSQNNPFSSIVPVSPDVAALGKFSDIPVGNYTGVPDITIPIFNIKQGSLDLPISLSYHAAGIKVTERASWAGLGWALNAGGMISRSIRGIPDEIGTEGYLNNNIAIPSGISFNDRYNAARGNLDLEPDLYYYNFLGYSGSFEMDRTGKTFITPYKDILLEGLHIQNGYKNNTVGPWRVALENGVVLLLESSETQISKALTSVLFSIHGGTTAWFVDEIISADKKDTIYFDYNDIYYSFPLTTSSSVYEDLGSVGCNSCSGGGTPIVNSGGDETEIEQYHTKQLSKIRFRGGSISFLATNATACYTVTPQSILREIDIANFNGEIIKKFNFQYTTYDPVNRTYLPSSQGNCTDIDDLDIFLTKIQENNNPPYMIDYNLDKGMPQKTSPQQDHWGYYNGSGITTLIPNPVKITSTRYTTGSGREANFDYAKQGTISQITYPTGGSTKFTFESNDVDADDAQNQTLLNQTFRTAAVSASSYQVDYGWNGHIVTTLTANQPYLLTTITFTMSNYQQTSNSTIALVNTANPYAQPVEVGFDFQGNNFWSGTVSVPNGTYNVVANKKITGPDVTSGQAYQLNINSYVNTYLLSNVPVDINGFRTAIVGGIRIKKTESFDPVTNNTLTKEYIYKNGSKGKSSGKLVWAINYDHVGKMYSCAYIIDDGDGFPKFHYGLEKYDILNASSNYPLGLTQGSPVGYSEVIVKNTSNGKDNGYEDYFYSTTADYPDQRTNPVSQQSGFFYSLGTVAPNCCTPVGGVSTDVNSSIFQYPFAPPISFDFARGQLIGKDIYKNTNVESSPYQLIQSTRNTYRVIDFSEALTGEKVGLIFDSYVGDAFSGYYPYSVPNGLCGAPYIEEQFSDYDFRKYNYILTSTNVKDYDANNNVTETTTTYDYNTELYAPNKITTITSKGDEKVVQSLFAVDYKNLTATDDLTKGIKNLTDNHFYDAVIEQYTQIKKRGEADYKTLQGIFTSYKPIEPLTDEVFQTAFSASSANSYQPSATFQPSSVSAGQVVKSALYQSKQHILQYDDYGNIQAAVPSDGIVNSFQWGYNNSYPTVHVLNAENSLRTDPTTTGIKEFYYEGFEESTAGNVLGGYLAHTGVKYYKGNFTVSFTLPNSKKYTIQWFSYANNKWSLNQHEYAANMILSGTIDDVRVFPANALMTSFTYAPLIGMTSKTDPSGRTAYYEYDGSARLKLIRDQNKNILKRACYSYSGQTIPCDIVQANDAAYGTFTKNDCGSGYTGSSVTYEVPAGTYSATTLQEANQLAQDDVNANGQAYANTFGTCAAITAIPFTYTNATGYPYTVSLVNSANNSIQYNNLTIQPNTDWVRTAGTIEPGTYNVTITPAGGTASHSYQIGNKSASGTGAVTVYNTLLTCTSCTLLQVTN